MHDTGKWKGPSKKGWTPKLTRSNEPIRTSSAQYMHVVCLRLIIRRLLIYSICVTSFTSASTLHIALDGWFFQLKKRTWLHAENSKPG